MKKRKENEKRIVRIDRWCFNCRKPLDFLWYMTNKDIRFTKLEKREIWNNKRFQLFCCFCYNRFLNKTLKIKNKKLEQLYSGSKTEPEQKTLKDIIRNIDPIDYRTLNCF